MTFSLSLRCAPCAFSVTSGPCELARELMQRRAASVFGSALEQQLVQQLARQP